MKLSLCIATYNEAKFIHFPLDSCIDWVDEVVIVDGGSTDKTVEIATSYGKKVKVFHEDNPPMFHINKQKAIERAKGDWILQLDADEEISPELKNEIVSVVTSQSQLKSDKKNTDLNQFQPVSTSSPPVAYWLSRKNYFLGRFLTKGGVYPDRTIRLYKNGAAKFPCKTVHENVEIVPTSEAARRSGLPAGRDSSEVYIGFLKNDLLHHADPEFSRYLKRWNRYNELDAKLLRESHEEVGFFNYVLWKPIVTFVAMYGRHKGFLDGWQGLVFAFFSSIRYIAIYTKMRVDKKK